MNLDFRFDIVAIIFFAGVYVATIINHSKQINEIKDALKNTVIGLENNFKNQVKNLTKSVNEHFQMIDEKQDRQLQNLEKNVSEHFKVLDKKQDKHNSMIERQFKTEGNIELLFEKIEVANHRIEDLEELQK